MTTAGLAALLRECARSRDPEAAHKAADEALVYFIDDAAVTAAYAALTRWYA